VVNVGVSTSRCSCCRPALSLRMHPVESSKFLVSSTGSMRESHPTLGSRSSSDRDMLESGWRSILWVWRTGGCGRKLIM